MTFLLIIDVHIPPEVSPYKAMIIKKINRNENKRDHQRQQFGLQRECVRGRRKHKSSKQRQMRFAFQTH